MTKAELLDLLAYFDDDDVVDEYTLNRLMRDLYDGYEERVEMLEERQEKSGMYAQQDLIEMYRMER